MWSFPARRWHRVAMALLGCAALFAVLLPAGRLGAEEELLGDEEAVESAGRALGGWSSYPWYDRETDSVQPLNVRPPSKPWNPPNLGWLGTIIGGFLEIMSYLVIWVIAPLIVLAIIYYLIRAFLDSERNEITTDSEETFSIDRIEALPAKIRVPVDSLLSEARRHYEAGDYRQAIIYLYSHQLLELDRKQLIRLAKGKTNRQYLRELASRKTLRELFEPTMFTFEDVFFGGRELTRAAFEACWERRRPFAGQLEGVPLS
ncbi:MAG: DUF4129 domain-containing protein [Planctomycetota bacterium]|nr:MAG: DUF4129 domain-containing protein [Planctomycetota bacterium]